MWSVKRSFIFDSDKVNNFKMPINKKKLYYKIHKEILQRPLLPTLLLHVFFTVLVDFYRPSFAFCETIRYVGLKGFDLAWASKDLMLALKGKQFFKDFEQGLRKLQKKLAKTFKSFKKSFQRLKKNLQIFQEVFIKFSDLKDLHLRLLNS